MQSEEIWVFSSCALLMGWLSMVLIELDAFDACLIVDREGIPTYEPS